MEYNDITYPGLGLIPKARRETVWNRSGASVGLGEVLMADIKAVDAASSKTQTNPGANDFPYNNWTSPKTAGIGGLIADQGYWFGVVTGLGTAGTGADDTQVEVTIRDRCKVKTSATVASGEYGKLYSVANTATGGASVTAATLGDGIRKLCRIEEDSTTAAGLGLFFFDGTPGAFGDTFTT